MWSLVNTQIRIEDLLWWLLKLKSLRQDFPGFYCGNWCSIFQPHNNCSRRNLSHAKYDFSNSWHITSNLLPKSCCMVVRRPFGTVHLILQYTFSCLWQKLCLKTVAKESSCVHINVTIDSQKNCWYIWVSDLHRH